MGAKLDKNSELWFDVGVKRYTTLPIGNLTSQQLWFDVGVKRYTTLSVISLWSMSCGLM